MNIAKWLNYDISIPGSIIEKEPVIRCRCYTWCKPFNLFKTAYNFLFKFIINQTAPNFDIFHLSINLNISNRCIRRFGHRHIRQHIPRHVRKNMSNCKSNQKDLNIDNFLKLLLVKNAYSNFLEPNTVNQPAFDNVFGEHNTDFYSCQNPSMLS